MITTAIAVSSDGATTLGSGATYGILIAILFSHGIVCSAATGVLARLNIFYVLINGELGANDLRFGLRTNSSWMRARFIFNSWRHRGRYHRAVRVLWRPEGLNT